MLHGTNSRQRVGTYAVVALVFFVFGVIGSGYIQRPKPFPMDQQPLVESAAIPIAPAPNDGGSDAAPQAGQQVSINRGTLAELDTLPGIGPVKAQAIIDYRTKINGFKSLEELKAVRGIGEKTYQKLLPLITL